VPFTPTWINWYNDVDGAKVACISGQYKDIPYGTVSDRTFYADGKPPHPEHGQFQRGLACSPTSRTIVIDVDKPEAWIEGNTYVELGDWDMIATSYREDGARAHIVVIVPEELLPLWPKQGPTVWGDVKSNGFSYHEGVHYSGMSYVATQNPWIVADAELLRALTSDRIFPQGKGSTGVMAGPWMKDDYRIGAHDECVATVMVMVQAGLTDQEVYERLELIMPNREGDWPERDAYIHEKISSARRKDEQWEKQEQDFWGSYHPAGYHGLVAELNRRILDRAVAAQPQNTAADAVEWIEHQIAEGLNLKRTPLELRLNPQMRPVEPRQNNDKSNAGEILEAAGPVIRFAADEGCWIQNTGTHWETWGTKSEKQEIGRTLVSAYGTFLKSEDDLAAELAAKGAAETEAEIEFDKARGERLGKIRTRFNGSGGQSQIATALITEARRSDRYSVNIAELDTEADVLWAGGYPWSLRHEALTLATEFRGVNPVHMKTAACAPYPGPTPAFDQLLAAVWPDPELRAWALREIAGVALWGATSKMHPVLDGAPHSGKSTLAEIIVNVLGTYAVQVSPDKILGGDVSSAHEEEVASMIGARLVWMDEPPPGGKQSISRFNDLASGTGKISAAKKFANKVSAPKLFNFIICQNSRNALRMDVQGVGERMTFIPCPGNPETTGEAWRRWKIEGQAEYAAVLALLIRECALFHQGQRLESPLGAQLGRAEAQERADEFGSWLIDTYKVLPFDTLTTDQRLTNSPTLGLLRTQYNDGHARANALPRIGAAEVLDQLNRLGIKVATAGQGNERKKNVVFVMPKAVSFSSGY
jgi:hypothetical protein